MVCNRGPQPAEQICIHVWVSHQIADVDDVGDSSPGWRGLPSGADRVVDGYAHSRLLLADGTADQSIAGHHYATEE